MNGQHKPLPFWVQIIVTAMLFTMMSIGFVIGVAYTGAAWGFDFARRLVSFWWSNPAEDFDEPENP